MVLEMELKYLNVPHDDIITELRTIEANFIGRYFENNLVFDDAARSLKNAETLLRLRRKGGSDGVLTLKRPPEKAVDSRLKVFEEFETVVAEPEVLTQILEGLGFEVAFQYEKIREKWSAGKVTICLDFMPFGEFVELEGPEREVLGLENKLGLDRFESSKATYHALNRRYRRENGMEEDENFIFSKKEKERIVNELK